MDQNELKLVNKQILHKYKIKLYKINKYSKFNKFQFNFYGKRVNMKISKRMNKSTLRIF